MSFLMSFSMYFPPHTSKFPASSIPLRIPPTSNMLVLAFGGYPFSPVFCIWAGRLFKKRHSRYCGRRIVNQKYSSFGEEGLLDFILRRGFGRDRDRLDNESGGLLYRVNFRDWVFGVGQGISVKPAIRASQCLVTRSCCISLVRPFCLYRPFPIVLSSCYLEMLSRTTK